MTSVVPGNVIRAITTFATSAGTAVDPSIVTYYVLDPNGTITSYVYNTDAEVARITTGSYVLTLEPDTPKHWQVYATGTGTNKGAGKGTFDVEPTSFD